MSKILYYIFGGIACLSIGLSCGLIAKDMTPTESNSNNNQQEQPEQPDTPTKDVPENDVSQYEIDGNTIVSYLGTAKHVVVPTSYSIGGTTRVYICKNYDVDFREWHPTLDIDFSDYSSLADDIKETGYMVVRDLILNMFEDKLISEQCMMDLDEYVSFCGSIARGWEPTGSEKVLYDKFSETMHLTSTYNDGIQTFTLYYDKANYVVGNDFQITTIGNHCFVQNDNIESITIGEGITDIFSASVLCCNNLHTISLPTSFSSIINSGSIINECRSLECISVAQDNETFTSGKDNLYLLNKSSGVLLTSLTTEIPTEATTLGVHLFDCLTGDLSVTVPDNITTILSFDLQGFNNSLCRITYFDCSLQFSSVVCQNEISWSDIKAGKFVTVVWRSNELTVPGSWCNVSLSPEEAADYEANKDKYTRVVYYVPDNLLSAYQEKYSTLVFKPLSELDAEATE